MENLVNSKGGNTDLCLTEQQTESDSLRWVLMSLNGVAMNPFSQKRKKKKRKKEKMSGEREQTLH
jgi:hypothetical protein